MRALLLKERSTLEVVNWPDPEPAEDEVLIRIRACGICGSDIHGWDGSSGRRQPPLIMGHEAAGEIVGMYKNVRGWEIGDRVTFDSTIHCGRCQACLSGEVNLCEQRKVVGVATDLYRQHGAFAELISLPARILHKLPDDLTFERAAMVEPVSVAMHAVSRTPLEDASVALVVGSGMIGLLVVQALRVQGVKTIIAVDLDAGRLSMARCLGATHAVLSGENALKAINEISRGKGVDVAYEVVGISATVSLAVSALRPGGSLLLVGNVTPVIDLSLQSVVTRELNLLGSCASAGEYPEAMRRIAAGDIEVDPMISAVAPLDDGIEWFNRLSGPEGGHYLKVILKP